MSYQKHIRNMWDKGIYFDVVLRWGDQQEYLGNFNIAQAGWMFTNWSNNDDLLNSNCWIWAKQRENPKSFAHFVNNVRSGSQQNVCCDLIKQFTVKCKRLSMNPYL